MEKLRYYVICAVLGLIAGALVSELTSFTNERHTAHIKAQCDKHHAEYIEIGNEKLCVKAVQ